MHVDMCERLLSYVQANHLVNWIGAKTFRQHICSPRYLDWCSIDRSASMEPLLQGALHQVNVGTCVAHLPKEKPCPGSEDRTVLSVYHNMRRVADAKIVHRECEQSSWWKHVRQALPRRRRRMWVLRAKPLTLRFRSSGATARDELLKRPNCGNRFAQNHPVWLKARR